MDHYMVSNRQAIRRKVNRPISAVQYQETLSEAQEKGLGIALICGRDPRIPDTGVPDRCINPRGG